MGNPVPPGGGGFAQEYIVLTNTADYAIDDNDVFHELQYDFVQDAGVGSVADLVNNAVVAQNSGLYMVGLTAMFSATENNSRHYRLRIMVDAAQAAISPDGVRYDSGEGFAPRWFAIVPATAGDLITTEAEMEGRPGDTDILGSLGVQLGVNLTVAYIGPAP